MVKFIATLLTFLVPSLMPSDITQDHIYSKNDLLGKIDYANSESFSKIASTYTSKSGIYMNSEAYEAFKNMHSQAKDNSVHLNIISAARNFDYQKGIWERKWKDGKYIKHFGADRARAIMRYSSMPGTSRHHWGTDIDINNLNDSYFLTGEGKEVYDWLNANAATFGFYQTYTSKDSGRTGYEEEKWHWSYMPISSKLLAAYNKQILYTDVSGFNGAESAEDLGAIKDYVNGIDSLLLIYD